MRRKKTNLRISSRRWTTPCARSTSGSTRRCAFWGTRSPRRVFVRALKVERFFKRGVSAIDKEWRAQFPDDATYISELSKKEYPSEANAVMRAATPFVHARAEKGARAD